jgi:hypothetical protein
MNSWDRQPFLTNIATGGGEYTYRPAYTETSHSMIIANYGASQSFDNGALRRGEGGAFVLAAAPLLREVIRKDLPLVAVRGPPAPGPAGPPLIPHPFSPPPPSADDGSSWYFTHDNFFYSAAGFKMDFVRSPPSRPHFPPLFPAVPDPPPPSPPCRAGTTPSSSPMW